MIAAIGSRKSGRWLGTPVLESDVGGLHGPGSPLPFAPASDHSPTHSLGDLPWDTRRRSRVRESRLNDREGFHRGSRLPAAQVT